MLNPNIIKMNNITIFQDDDALIKEKFNEVLNETNLSQNGTKSTIEKISEVSLGKKKRRKKCCAEDRRFQCNNCGKRYYSYPALYTHKRNKHNIIPITNKHGIFKNNPTKFKYSAIYKKSLNHQVLFDYIIERYTQTIIKYFTDSRNILYQKNFDINQQYGLQMLKSKTFLDIKLNKNTFIDHALNIYLYNFIIVSSDNHLKEIVIRFVILLREYLNIAGWDYKKKYFDHGIKIIFNPIGSYTLHNTCEEIPDLINDFISVFVNMDINKFDMNSKDIFDLCHNFCNWLFVNDLTNYKATANFEDL